MYASLPSAVCGSVASHQQKVPHLQSGHRSSVRKLMLFLKTTAPLSPSTPLCHCTVFKFVFALRLIFLQ